MMDFDRSITAAYIFVPINVLVACAIGTFCAFASAKEPIKDRALMWKLALSCFFMGAAFTAITNAMLGFFLNGLQMTDPLQSAVGAVISYLTRSFLPWLRESVETGSWTKYVPFIRHKQDSSE